MLTKALTATLLAGLMFTACCSELQVDSTIVATYTVRVDYDAPLSRSISSAVYPGGSNPNITDANFPAERSGTRDVTIDFVRFHDDDVSLEEAEAAIRRRGLRQATLRELHAVSAQNQLRSTEVYGPVGALGTEWEDTDSRPPACGYWFERKILDPTDEFLTTMGGGRWYDQIECDRYHLNPCVDWDFQEDSKPQIMGLCQYLRMGLDQSDRIAAVRE